MTPEQRREEFEATLGFRPDPFQAHAIDALIAGRSVLVAAPTGAGKTVVGEFCCHDALEHGGKTFYTTPIKALSNQKYRDLVRQHGPDRVGLLTGDRAVNGDASVVVMTTEVVRNMLYESSPTLRGLRHVVLDEVHYLADRERGGVWEEVLIQLPASVQVAALSATVSNAEEFGDWLAEVRHDCAVIIEEHRPVPLRHHYWVNDRIHPTFRAGSRGGASREHREQAAQARAGVPNPDVLMLERQSQRATRVTHKGRHVRVGPKLRYPSRPDVVEELARRKWLPAIVFVFSRRGCEQAVEELVRSGVRLTSGHERDEIARTVDTMLADIPAEDLAVLDFDTWRGALLDGIAAHHAGMVPAFKEVVEVCFQAGWLKVVVATETLALGINMPARTVVIERLEKWNGESHVMLTPGEYTQLTGRAGRRGIDTVGNAVVTYQRNIEFRTVAGLVGTRAYPLRSSFAPSYNMAVNLLRHHDQHQAETLLGASFAQFQADRATGGLGVRLAEAEEGLRGYGQHLACDHGDWPAYWALRRELSATEKRGARDRRRDARAAQREGLAALQPGDVMWLPWLGRRGLAAVVGIQLTSRGIPIAQVVADDRSLTRIGPRELDGAPVVVDRVRLPKGNPRQRDYRGEVASRLRGVAPPLDADQLHDQGDRPAPDPAVQEEIRRLQSAIDRHPCHACPDREDHERWQYRADDLAREAEQLRDRIEHRTGSLVRQFHRIVEVLQRLGYLDGQPRPTADGMRLAGIYSQVDLLVAEAVGRGLLDGLDAPEVAGICGLFLYEPRGGEPTLDPRYPTERLRATVQEVHFLAEELRGVERDAGLDPMGDLDAGFVAAAYRWAAGLTLEEAVEDLDITGGDFVRTVKMLADLAGQLRTVGDTDLAAAAHRAVDGLRRGIVEA